MIAALVLIPAISGLLAFFLRPARPRRALLLLAAALHTALTAAAWAVRPKTALDGWLAIDPAGLLFLTLTSVLFLAAAVYGTGYLIRESRQLHRDHQDGLPFTNAPETVLVGCLLLFEATMTLVCVSHNLGLLWVAIEATTLASAPMIYFHRQRRSLEAVWKYLLICSVGIALALLGNFFLKTAAMGPGGGLVLLNMDRLLAAAPHFQIFWLKAAFLFLLVGYGTKMGLAPLHTWLPDAHSEAPSVVSALLSGALLNCAFLGILRIQQICVAAGEGAFGRDLLVLFGLLSMAFAAVFILSQTDYKRMLAYSSVEHMGILALGVGIGGAGVFGALFHAMNHSLTKAMLFFVAGNILTIYQTKFTSGVRGLWRVAPLTGGLWVMGFFSITGSPPFGTFLSEFTILKAALDQGRPVVGIFYLALLSLVFIGMAGTMLRMAQGQPEFRGGQPAAGEDWLAVAPPAVLGLLVFLLGIYMPPALSVLLHQAARLLGGN